MQPQTSSETTDATRAKNEGVLHELPFDNTNDFEDAQRGFVGTTPNLTTKSANGIRLNAEKADGVKLAFSWKLAGGETYALEVRNSVLIYTKDKKLAKVDAALTAEKSTVAGVIMGSLSLDTAIRSGAIKIDGDIDAVKQLFGLLDAFELMFNIMTP